MQKYINRRHQFRLDLYYNPKDCIYKTRRRKKKKEKKVKRYLVSLFKSFKILHYKEQKSWDFIFFL